MAAAKMRPLAGVTWLWYRERELGAVVVEGEGRVF